MGYVDRAHSMHGRGDVFAAAVTLASGLKRAPEDEDALDWFLSLYLEELPNPGLEREVLQVLAQRHDGGERFDFLVAELEHLGREDKIDALELAMDRHRIVLPEPRMAPPNAPEPEADAGPEADEEGERWDQFESPLEARHEPSGHVGAVPETASARTEHDGEDLDEREPSFGFDDGAEDEHEGPVSVRRVDASELPARDGGRGLMQMLLLGIALLLAAALMVWVAFSSAPPLSPAGESPAEVTGSGTTP